jgi:hypothetical protein
MSAEAPLEVGFVVALLFFGSIVAFAFVSGAGLAQEDAARKELLAKLTLAFMEDAGINDKLTVCIVTGSAAVCGDAEREILALLDEAKVGYCTRVYTTDGSLNTSTCPQGSEDKSKGVARGYLISNVSVVVEVTSS